MVSLWSRPIDAGVVQTHIKDMPSAERDALQSEIFATWPRVKLTAISYRISNTDGSMVDKSSHRLAPLGFLISRWYE